MDPFGISNNSITSAKQVYDAHKSFEESQRALDKKNQEDEEYKKKLLETTMVLNEIKSIVDQQKKSVEEFNNSSNKISKRMYWLTIAIAGLTVVLTIVAIIQLIKIT